MKSKLWLFLVAFALIFSACEKDGEFNSLRPDGHEGRFIADLGDNCLIDFEGDVATTKLIAGQHYEVGSVTVKEVENEEGHFIKVTYKTDEGWFLTETHLHVAPSPEGIPGYPGNPRIGHFKYGEDDIPFETEVYYLIPYNDDWEDHYIAAHAVVVDGLSVSSEIGGEAQVVVSQPVADAESYFPNISVSNNLVNGDFNGWCLEADKLIDGNEHTFDVFSSYGDLPDGYSQEFINRVNWILNERFQDKDDYTHGDVQMAIWVLKTNATNLADAKEIEPRLDCGSAPRVYLCGIIPFDDDNIDQIVSQAIEEGSEFVPECGGVFAILLINEYKQDLIIEYPVACDETAWGQGCLFNDKSWAMYFKVRF